MAEEKYLVTKQQLLDLSKEEFKHLPLHGSTVAFDKHLPIMGIKPLKGLTMDLQPEEIFKNGDLQQIGFNVTLIIDKDNKLTVIDNTQEDWKDLIDCNTLVVKPLTIDVG